MNNLIAVPIENFRIWSGGSWVKYTDKSSNLLLRINYDQVLVISDDKVIETLNINKKLKGIFKDDILILIIGDMEGRVRKIKFKIRDNLLQCLQELRVRFPVVAYDTLKNKQKTVINYNSIEDVFKSVLENGEKMNMLPLPVEYSKFVKLCLLDPMFPEFVNQTKQILDKEILNNNSLP